MSLDAEDKKRLAEAVRTAAPDSVNAVEVSMRERHPLDHWDLLQIQRDINAAAYVRPGAWGYIATVSNANEYQTFVIFISVLETA